MGDPQQPSPHLAAGREAEAQQRFADAEAHYRAVPRDDAAFPAALIRLGILAARTARNQLARQYFEHALALKPDSAEALEWLATFARQDGIFMEAIALFRRAAELDARNLRVWFSLADTYLEIWYNETAIEGFRRILAVTPDFAPAHDRLGVALWREGQIEEAITCFRAAIRLAPSMPTGYANLAQLYLRNDRPREAEAVFQAAAEFASGSVNRLIEFAGTYLRYDNIPQAEAMIRHAIQLDPSAELPKFLLGRLLQKDGRFADSERVLEALIEERPNFAQAYFDLLRTRKTKPEDRPLLVKVDALVKLPETTHADRQQLHYALGKAYDDLGEYGPALRHFEEANGLAALRLPDSLKDKASAKATTDQIISTFTPELIARFQKLGSPDSTPIFIAGMIRSGTTLMEQIVSSHPSVGAAGELRYLIDHASEVMAPDLETNRSKIRTLADGYLRRLKFEAPGRERVTDKMPDNIMVLGLIRILFPNAKLIICRRNPYDNCLSAFVTPHDVPQAFLYSAENLGFLYKEQHRLTDHWKATIPSECLMLVDYEDIVTQPESTIRAVIEFLCLPWDPACLVHEKNARVIHTPSLWQVRQGMYTSSLDRWRNYEPWINELKGFLKAP